MMTADAAMSRYGVSIPLLSLLLVFLTVTVVSPYVCKPSALTDGGGARGVSEPARRAHCSFTETGI